MPLSEHEQRLLDEMERSLYHGDGDVVAGVGRRTGRPAYRAIVLGILLAVVGVAALIVGVVLQIPLIGIVGFAVMFGGVLIAVTPRRGGAAAQGQTGPAQRDDREHHQQGFMDKLNERWDKRQNDH